MANMEDVKTAVGESNFVVLAANYSSNFDCFIDPKNALLRFVAHDLNLVFRQVGVKIESVATADQYVQLSDKTLWLLISRNMTIPVYVMKVGNEQDHTKLSWFLWPAMEIRQAAFDWFTQAAESISIEKIGKYFRCVNPAAIGDLLKKADGVTPEWYYKDKVIESQDKEVKRVAVSGETNEIGTGIPEDMVDELVEKVSICTRGTMKVILNALNHVILDWLIVKRKPVNLGFATIAPIPYRSNWKPALLRFYPNSASVFARRKQDVEPFAESIGLMYALLSRELLSINPTMNTCEWTIEITPGRMFNEASIEAEQQRISAKGPSHYSSYIAHEISKNRSVILELYRRYIEGSMRAFAKFSEVGGRDSQVLLPCSWGGQSHQRRLESATADLAIDRPVDWEKPKLTSLIEDTVRSLPALSDVRQQVAELRNTREDDE